jgi:hypothetical protein
MHNGSWPRGVVARVKNTWPNGTTARLVSLLVAAGIVHHSRTATITDTTSSAGDSVSVRPPIDLAVPSLASIRRTLTVQKGGEQPRHPYWSMAWNLRLVPGGMFRQYPNRTDEEWAATQPEPERGKMSFLAPVDDVRRLGVCWTWNREPSVDGRVCWYEAGHEDAHSWQQAPE